MKLCTIRTSDGHRAARIAGDKVILLANPNLKDSLSDPENAPLQSGPTLLLSEVDLAPLIPNPDKIICVGQNYAGHIAEMGRPTPEFPNYFPKFSGTLIGPYDDITLPPPEVSTDVDWEAELCVVIGSPVRHGTAAEAASAIAGFCVANDVSMRDWQRRSSQFLAGKAFEGTCPVGPFMVTTDEIGDGSGLGISCQVDGVTKQQGSTDDLVFKPVDLVQDLSRIMTLLPGDLIPTGTPSGVGAARTPPEWITDGAEVVTTVEGIGELRNTARLQTRG